MSDAIADEDTHHQLQQCLMNHIFKNIKAGYTVTLL